MEAFKALNYRMKPILVAYSLSFSSLGSLRFERLTTKTVYRMSAISKNTAVPSVSSICV